MGNNEILFGLLSADSCVDMPPDDTIALLRRLIDGALLAEGFPYHAEIGVTFADDDGIRELNLAERGIDAATDVLSFPLIPPGGMGGISDADLNPDTGAVQLGDIVISLERATAQAEEYGHTIGRELGFLTVHALLHLLGYDHVDDGSEKLMMDKTERILADEGLTR